MTNDERKRQRELFETWAERAMFDSPLLNPLATNTSGDCYLWPVAQNKWNAWQAACEANGVGEPSEMEGLTDDELSALIEACNHADRHGQCRPPWNRAGVDAKRKLVNEERRRAALAKQEEQA